MQAKNYFATALILIAIAGAFYAGSTGFGFRAAINHATMPAGQYALALQGNTFYVSPNGNGSRNGDSPENSFSLSDAQAYANTRTNEEITFKLAGGYYGRFLLDNAPARSSGTWVTWKANEEGVVFEKISVKNSVKRNAFIRFDGVNVQHSDPKIPCNDASDASVGECGGKWCMSHPNAPGYLAYVKNANFVELLNGTYRGFSKYISNNITVLDSDNVKIDHSEISNTVDGVQLRRDSQNFKFLNNYIHHLSQGSTVRLLDPNYKKFGTLIENNHIADQKFALDPAQDDNCYLPWHAIGTNAVHAGSGISVRISNVTIRNNIIRQVFPQSIMFYGGAEPKYNNMVLENNLIYDSGRVALYNSGENVLVRNNTIVSGVRFNGTGKYDIIQRYEDRPYLGIDFNQDIYDGSGIEVYNNVIVGNWSLEKGINKENNNIFWRRYEDSINQSKGRGANTLIVIWTESTSPYTLHGNPNFFEDIGFTRTTPEYDYARDGIKPFFVNPGFRTGEAGKEDSGKIWDYKLAPTSTAINFGDASKQPADSLGTLGTDGFISRDGPVRDAAHHSAGAYEFSDSTPACTNGQTRQCGTTDTGECSYGIQTCSNGTWGSCIGTANPTTEICDNKDNDCNGQTDEGNICCPDYALETTANNNCADSKDNDCDTKTDTADEGCQTAECTVDSQCPTGQTCQNSACAAECIDEVKLSSNISEWKQGNITMLALMQKMKQWKAGTGC